MSDHLFTSESVTEGHPDKVADQISDAVLDAILTQDPAARVAVETLLTGDLVVLGGEITTTATVDLEQIARNTILAIGYDDEAKGLNGRTCRVQIAVGRQSPDIAQSVNQSLEARTGSGVDDIDSQGAGDQGMMFGYATSETPAFMPTPIQMAHELSAQLTAARKSGAVSYLRPDGKTQVTIAYQGNTPVAVHTILISTQHDEPHPDDTGFDARLRADLIHEVINPVLANYPHLDTTGITVLTNPSGRFVIGGPAGDAGLTGRKIIVDTYGGMARHGGGAFSGKDPSKVDRSGAYVTRWIARHVIAAGLADRCEVQISYAIGQARPIAVYVNTFGATLYPDTVIAEAISATFDLRPAAIIRDLQLLDATRNRYQESAASGHFGTTGYPSGPPTWEVDSRAATLADTAIRLHRERSARDTQRFYNESD